MAGRARGVKLERRLDQPWWFSVAVPVGSLVFAFAVIAVVLALTGHDAVETYRRSRRRRLHRQRRAVGDADLGHADPVHRARRRGRLPHAALQHRRRGAALPRRRRGVVDRAAARRSRRTSTALYVVAMCVAAAALGALWALIPGVLRAFARTNEIITSLMLNYVAGAVPDVPDLRQPLVLARHVDATGPVVPAGQAACPRRLLADARLARWSCRWGSSSAIAVAAASGSSTRARASGSRCSVIGDSPRAARYAGMRTRRKILAVMCLSGAIAGIGGASQMGDFSPRSTGAHGPAAAAFGYTGIVVAALARYNPFAVVPRRGAHRRAAERRLHAPGRRLPVRARRRDAGDDPVLRARRRAARAVPACSSAGARRRTAAARGGRRARQRQPRSSSCSRRPWPTGRRSCTRRSASSSPSARACSTSVSRG